MGNRINSTLFLWGMQRGRFRRQLLSPRGCIFILRQNSRKCEDLMKIRTKTNMFLRCITVYLADILEIFHIPAGITGYEVLERDFRTNKKTRANKWSTIARNAAKPTLTSRTWLGTPFVRKAAIVNPMKVVKQVPGIVRNAGEPIRILNICFSILTAKKAASVSRFKEQFWGKMYE